MPHLQQWRLIIDLSHPAGHSVNDGIPKNLCSLSYVMLDTAIWLTLGLEHYWQRLTLSMRCAF